MSIDLIITLTVIAVAIIFFVTEWLPVGQTAMLAAALLLVGGVVSGDEVFSGFSNHATVTVGSMFVVSAAILRTGAVNLMGKKMTQVLGASTIGGLAVASAGAGMLSAFINNTTVIAILLPLLVKSARDIDVSASKLLIPVCFTSILGGTCTLIGTSTNLIVSSFAEQGGLEPIGMFELAPVGLALFAFGVGYMLLIGRRLIPARREVEEREEQAHASGYITDLQISEENQSIGEPIDDASLFDGLDCDVISVWREGKSLGGIPPAEFVLEDGDIIRVRCAVSDLPRLAGQDGTTIVTGSDRPADLESGDVIMAEAVIPPRSPLAKQTIGNIPFRERFNAVVLAVRQRGRTRREQLYLARLEPGDVLLLGVQPDSLSELEMRNDFVVVSELPVIEHRRSLMPIALAILGSVVATAALGWLSVSSAAVVGAVTVLITGCLRLDEAVDAIDWNVIMLLAGVISIGHAMENSGATTYLADYFVNVLSGRNIHVTVGALYLGTTLMTSILSNNATAALVTPLAIVMAVRIGVDTRPFIMAVAFGASTAFLTPIGYQTNAMIYGPGRYRFSDYARVGGPLVIGLSIIVSILVPMVWPA